MCLRIERYVSLYLRGRLTLMQVFILKGGLFEEGEGLVEGCEFERSVLLLGLLQRDIFVLKGSLFEGGF